MSIWNIENAKEYVKSIGSEMKSDKWTGTHGFYYFKCIECGEWKYTSFHNIQSGNLKCVKCGTKKGQTTTYINICKKCGVEFVTLNSRQQYCADKCRQKIERIDVTKEILTDLYIIKRISALNISKMLNIAKPVILRKLRKFVIAVRTSSESKHEEGFKLPTKEELKELYINQFLSYNEICKIYNVDASLIMLWLRKYKIPSRKTSETRLGKNFKNPTKEELIDLYINKNLNSKDMGALYGVSGSWIVRQMRSLGMIIKDNTFGNSSYLKSGIKVKSSYEKIFGDLLCDNNIKFIYEPQLPFDHHYHSDFLIDDIYVEIWGVVNSKKYDERKNKKKNLYEENNLKLFDLYPKDFKENKSKIKQLISLIEKEQLTLII